MDMADKDKANEFGGMSLTSGSSRALIMSTQLGVK